MQDPWDEPGKPGRPEVTDYDADRIDLSWEPPHKDGGAPIEGYIVEVRDPDTKEWKEIAKVQGETDLLDRSQPPVANGISFRYKRLHSGT